MKSGALILPLLLLVGCSAPNDKPVPEVATRQGRIWQAEWDEHVKDNKLSIRFLGNTFLDETVRFAWRIYAPKGAKLAGLELEAPSVVDVQIVVARDETGAWTRRQIVGVQGEKSMGLKHALEVLEDVGMRVNIKDGQPEESVKALSNPEPGPNMKIASGLPDEVALLPLETR